jgi:hypothetical protein
MGDAGDIYTSHIYQLTAFERADQEQRMIIVPMRHPITTMHSWAKWAAKSTEDYSGDIVNPKNVPNLYKNIIWADELFDINYVPIDSPYREEFLYKLRRRTGLPLVTEWAPLNSIGQSDVQASDYLIEKAERLMDDNREFFENFYNY